MTVRRHSQTPYFPLPLRRYAASPLSCGRGDTACGPAKPVPRLFLIGVTFYGRSSCSVLISMILEPLLIVELVLLGLCLSLIHI